MEVNKMRRVLVLVFVSLFLIGGSAFAAPAPKCGHPTCQLYASLPLEQRDGLTKAGRELGNEKQLAKLYATARLNGRPAYYPAGQKLSLVIDNEGLDKLTYVTDHQIRGRHAFGQVAGKNVKVFVPDNREFTASITVVRSMPSTNPSQPAVSGPNIRYIYRSGPGQQQPQYTQSSAPKTVYHAPKPVQSPSPTKSDSAGLNTGKYDSVPYVRD